MRGKNMCLKDKKKLTKEECEMSAEQYDIFHSGKYSSTIVQQSFFNNGKKVR
jgi:hypothetical protein